MFAKLKEAGLIVKERKCTFGEANCEYLGYIVGSSTVKPMEGKVTAIKAFAKPKVKKDVRVFFGYVWFIGNLLIIFPQ